MFTAGRRQNAHKELLLTSGLTNEYQETTFFLIISYQRVNMKIETSKHIFLHIVLSCMCVTDSYWYPNTKIVCTVLHF